jgi:hypothetical protein
MLDDGPTLSEAAFGASAPGAGCHASQALGGIQAPAGQRGEGEGEGAVIISDGFGARVHEIFAKQSANFWKAIEGLKSGRIRAFDGEADTTEKTMARLEEAAAVVGRAQAEVLARFDTRYSFTAQFLVAGAMFARDCRSIEKEYTEAISGEARMRHRGLVTAAIMHSVAAVESEAAELTLHGPGSHLGSGKTDTLARELLRPLAEVIDDQPTLQRFKLILHLLQKSPLTLGAQPWQDMATLVRLRNEIIHYKSHWGSAMEQKRFFSSTLANLKLEVPPFVHASENFFPHQLLSAACAE